MHDHKNIDVFKPVIYEDAIEEAVETLRSGWIGAGPKINEFEQKFSRHMGTKHCIAVNSGSSALHLALKCLNLPKNSKVITSEISHIGAVNAIYYAGLVPVFADVEKTTGNISVDDVRIKIDDDVKAILCTHIGGYPCDMDGLRELSKEYAIPLVEDCSHAIGSIYKGEKIGNGMLCCFSFSFPKAITGIEGGAILTIDAGYAEKARALRNFGMKDGMKFSDSGYIPFIDEIGFRYNWNDVMASIAIKQMDHTEADNRRRKQIANRYGEALANINGITLPSYENDRWSSYFFIPIFFDRREALIRKLQEHGVGTKIYFKRFNEFDHESIARVPNAEWYGSHELTLPINAYITDEEIDFIISIIKEGW